MILVVIALWALVLLLVSRTFRWLVLILLFIGLLVALGQ